MSGHRQHLHRRFGENLFVGLDTACLRCCCSLLPGSLSSLSTDPQHPRFCLVQGPARPSPGRQSHSHGSMISLAPFHTHVILPATISHHSQSSSKIPLLCTHVHNAHIATRVHAGCCHCVRTLRRFALTVSHFTRSCCLLPFPSPRMS